MREAGNLIARNRPPSAAAAALASLALLLAGCSDTHSSPCSSDSECPDGRCRRGACGPRCLGDSECGTDQVCTAGKCLPRPECQQEDDCAQGFICAQGSCQCQADAACAANQSCVEGKCQTKTRCRGDEDCAGTGGRCEVTQGLCIPPCHSPADCAPGMAPAAAATLYQCFQGTCYRRCLNDLTCGQGLICKDGLCAVASCTTLADCPQGQYCTSESFGRCAEFRPCSSQSQCAANFECKPFAPGQCPPGFPCALSLCQELPTCLIDPDCARGASLPGQSPAYCQDGHCQKTVRCASSSGCGAGFSCVAAVCVPGGCRGLADCPSGQACVEGACAQAPAPGDINLLKLVPRRAVLAVGDSAVFTLIAYRLDGSSFPLPGASFEVLEEGGAPSPRATIGANGVLTAVSAGEVIIRGWVTGANVPAQEARATVHPPVVTGRRVLVIEAANSTPLAGVVVLGCEGPPPSGPCPAPVEVTTDANGEAHFAGFGAGPASFSMASPQVRADGLPRYDRVSVVATSASDLFIPLAENPVRAAAGFTASIQFSELHSTGQYWAGFAAVSAGDLTELDLGTLLGEPFFIEVPGVGQKLPVPGSVVLYTSPGFGIAQPIKSKSLGLGQPGLRSAVAFAGRTELNQALDMRSLQFLAYTGAMDFALQPEVAVNLRPRVPDASDLNNNGLCASPQKCPSGPEEVPDYPGFTGLSFTPKRQQNRRTEVVLPNVPSELDTVVVAAVETSREAGVFPLGFSSASAGPSQNGSRPVASLTLRSGAPYGGTEVALPGIWALATRAELLGSFEGGSLTARLTHSAVLPTRVVVKPFLPLASGSSYSPATRLFSPGQPEWNALVSAGGELAKVVLTGAQSRHLVYFPMSGGQTAVRVPEGPAAGIDPAGQQASTLQVVALDLSAGVGAEEAFTLGGANLSGLSAHTDGYSRFEK